MLKTAKTTLMITAFLRFSASQDENSWREVRNEMEEKRRKRG